MLRKMFLLPMICLLCSFMSGYAAIESDSGDLPVAMEKTAVSVDGVTEFTGYYIDGRAYVPLRSFCGSMNMGAVVTQNTAAGTMHVNMEHQGTTYILTARVGDFYLYLNDRIVYLEADILCHRGNILVPLSGLCHAFGITAVCEESTGALNLHTESLRLCSAGSEVYDPDDLKWLSHIINAEAGNQSMEGQICVGNVVLNRVADERFPDTVEAVIFSPNQFCPVKSGTIWCIPDEDAIAAAKLCLEGVNLAGESTYFVNPVTGSTRWFRENLTYAMSVGDHDFYY